MKELEIEDLVSELIAKTKDGTLDWSLALLNSQGDPRYWAVRRGQCRFIVSDADPMFGRGPMLGVDWDRDDDGMTEVPCLSIEEADLVSPLIDAIMTHSTGDDWMELDGVLEAVMDCLCGK